MKFSELRLKIKNRINKRLNRWFVTFLNFVRKRLFSNRKVFAIGFNKSGTTSLHALFLSLGLSSYHGVEWRDCCDLDLFSSYQCFSDDIPRDLPRLDCLFPKSKYILQVRDLDNWVLSRLAHIQREKESNTYIGGPEWDLTVAAVKSWILKRNTYHLYVFDYFSSRPGDLLVINFIRDPNSATRVANFLGYPGRHRKPQKNINSNPDIPQLHIDLLESAASELEISPIELKYDLLCGSLITSRTPPVWAQDTSNLVHFKG